VLQQTLPKQKIGEIFFLLERAAVRLTKKTAKKESESEEW